MSTKTCKYFFSSGCSNGKKCPFSHVKQKEKEKENISAEKKEKIDIQIKLKIVNLSRKTIVIFLIF
jgi:hypothetical protein